MTNQDLQRIVKRARADWLEFAGPEGPTAGRLYVGYDVNALEGAISRGWLADRHRHRLRRHAVSGTAASARARSLSADQITRLRELVVEEHEQAPHQSWSHVCFKVGKFRFAEIGGDEGRPLSGRRVRRYTAGVRW